MRPVVILALALGAAVAAPLGAQRPPVVVEAQRSGTAGEKYNGYQSAVGVPTPALRRQVSAVNIRRRSLYANLARRRGVTAEEVGLTAGCAMLARVPVGGYYMLVDGAWRQRTASEPVILPSYCR
jgi:uncharacterized protein YdbL (DUF1318 family)